MVMERMKLSQEEQVTTDLADRLERLADIARTVQMHGWTPKYAIPEPELEWSAGYVVATACMQSGETMTYSIHLGADGESWWHSVTDIFVPNRRWIKVPMGIVASSEIVAQMLDDKRRRKEEAEKEIEVEFDKLLEEHILILG